MFRENSTFGSARADIRKICKRKSILRRASAATFERLEQRQLLSGVPTVTIAGSPSTTEGADYNLALSSSNLGSLTIDHWTIAWGDGQSTVPGSASSADHFYSDGPNTFTISASATLSDNSVVQANLGTATVTSDGSLDPAFGSGGQVETTMPGAGAAGALAVQADGKILQAGSDVGGNGTLVRYNTDGTVDGSFGVGGKVVIPGATAISKMLIETVANPFNPTQTVQRILISGDVNASHNGALWRFTLDNSANALPDGSPDTGFGGTGFVLLPDFTAGAPGNNIAGMTIDSAGRIVTAGTSWGFFNNSNQNQSVSVARLNVDGSMDSSFGNNGEQVKQLSTFDGSSTGLGVVTGSDNSVEVLAFGTVTGQFENHILRFTSGGVLDPTYGTGGVLSIDNPFYNFLAIAIDSDGQVVLGGSHVQGSNNFFSVARYSYDGAPDASMIGNGFDMVGAHSTYTGGSNGVITTLTTTADGKIEAAGKINAFSGPGAFTQNEGVLRLNHNGTDDSSFGNFMTGLSNVDFAGGTDTAEAVVVQTDGKVLVGGESFVPGVNVQNWTLVRLGFTNPASGQPVTVSVANVAPTPSISGSTSGPEGSAINVSGSATDPSSADTAAGFTFAWSVTKNGSAFATGSGANYSFTPDDNGTYVVTLSATDKDGGTGSVSSTINVTNVAPSVTLSAPATGSEGSAISFSGSASDPSSADTSAGLTLGWAVTKNGSPFASGSGASSSFTPNDNGVYIVTLSASDKDGGVGSKSQTINVSNVAPTPAFSAPSTGTEGTAISLSGSATDPSSVDTAAGFGFSWTVTKNGTAFGSTGSSANYSFTPNDNGTYVVKLTVTDKDGGSNSLSKTIAVGNVGPSVGPITAPAAAVRGQTVTFGSTFSDPGVLDTHTITWDFGDGSPVTTTSAAAGVTGAISSSHVFAATGTYTVKVTVVDKDGGTGSSTRSFKVDAVDLQVDPTNSSQMAIFVGGTSGADSIVVDTMGDEGSPHGFEVDMNGTEYEYKSSVGRVVVFGGAGNDVIYVTQDVTIPTELYGGDGNDSIKGGGGSNIEVGGAGNDTIFGGGGRDVLIGGGGRDSMVGGSGDDVLVAMSTIYDANPTALESMQKEWNRTDKTFSQRVSDLTHGGGFNGTNVFNSTTTSNDNTTDSLTGGSGSDLFVVDSGDIITDLSRDDSLLNLG